ncbi:MAG: hypothetical protein WKF74_02935 [Pyrinomonadaceae bacterium]
MKDDELIREGEKFVVAKDTKIHGLTSWKAPCTGSFECVIPSGVVMVAYDQVPGAEGFCAVPERYEEMERFLVPASDTSHPKYAGYYFVFLRENVGDELIPIK